MDIGLTRGNRTRIVRDMTTTERIKSLKVRLALEAQNGNALRAETSWSEAHIQKIIRSEQEVYALRLELRQWLDLVDPDRRMAF